MITFGAGHPHLLAGTKFLCPKCSRPQARLTQKLYWGQDIAIRDKNYQVIGYRVEWLAGKVTDRGRITTLSRCCLVSWHHNACLFVDRIGWFPHNPYRTKPAQSEQEGWLSKLKRHFFVYTGKLLR